MKTIFYRYKIYKIKTLFDGDIYAIKYRWWLFWFWETTYHKGEGVYYRDYERASYRVDEMRKRDIFKKKVIKKF